MPVPYYLDYYNFEVSFEVGKYEFANFVLFFQDSLGNILSLLFP